MSEPQAFDWEAPIADRETVPTDQFFMGVDLDALDGAVADSLAEVRAAKVRVAEALERDRVLREFREHVLKAQMGATHDPEGHAYLGGRLLAARQQRVEAWGDLGPSERPKR